jgi:hypothetical protein
MQIAQVSQVDILKAFRNRLLDQIPDFFGPDNLYFDDAPLPRGAPDFDLCCSLAVSNGVFGTEGYERSTQPPCAVVEAGHIYVTPMARMESEQPHNLNLSLVYDEDRGLISVIKPRIMSALLVDYDGSTGTRKRWEPKNSSGHSLFCDTLTLTGCTAPQEIESYPFLGITLDFRVNWVWQL